VVGYKDLSPLNEEIAEYGLRRTFDQVRGDMPKKTVEWESVEMSDRHAAFYDAIRKGVREEADKIELNASNLLALTTRLRQATASPSILTSEAIPSSKLERAAEICEDLLAQGEKVVVMSSFKEPCSELAARLSEFRPAVVTGDVSEDAAQRLVAAFRDSPDSNLLICTIARMGTGFSMPECRYMVFVDQPWTDAAFAQACDRIYRITSGKPVFIKCLVCRGTIDERVREIVESKRDLADYMVDGKPGSRLADEMRKIVREL
jgi:SNF2 family DNA or RNA helicase